MLAVICNLRRIWFIRSTAAILSYMMAASVLAYGQAKIVQLHNGHDLNNWTIESNGQFVVEDGVLRVNRGTGWLRSRERFKDFKLTMVFRFLEAGANSGIYIRTAATSNNGERGYPDNGYQVQCRDAITGETPLGCMFAQGAPEFRFVEDLNALRRAYVPTGEWNVYEITCRGDSVSVKLNGVLVTIGIGMAHADGYIGIQGEYGLLEFRVIQVEKL